MVSSPRARAKEILYSGALAQISGLVNSGKAFLDVIQSGSLDCVNAVTAQGHWIAPCDCTVVGAFFQVITQLGTGAATIGAGLITNTDSIVDDYSVAISVTAGTIVDLTSDASFLGGDLTRGDVVVFQSDGGATSTGAVVMGLVVVAR